MQPTACQVFMNQAATDAVVVVVVDARQLVTVADRLNDDDDVAGKAAMAAAAADTASGQLSQLGINGLSVRKYPFARIIRYRFLPPFLYSLLSRLFANIRARQPNRTAGWLTG